MFVIHAVWQNGGTKKDIFSLVPRLRLPNDLCDDCLEGTAAIGDFLISEEEIEFQIIEFIEYICTDPDSFTICSENIVLVRPSCLGTCDQPT